MQPTNYPDRNASLSIRSRAPNGTSPQVRRVMLANRPDRAKLEQRLRSTLHRSGLRFWKNRRPVPELRCEADVVFPGARVCVFVDGCFWHGCTQHFRVPKSNAAWWTEKVRATVERDRRQEAALETHGWTVLRVWEHELAGAQLESKAAEVAMRVGQAGAAHGVNRAKG